MTALLIQSIPERRHAIEHDIANPDKIRFINVTVKIQFLQLLLSMQGMLRFNTTVPSKEAQR